MPTTPQRLIWRYLVGYAAVGAVALGVVRPLAMQTAIHDAILAGGHDTHPNYVLAAAEGALGGACFGFAVGIWQIMPRVSGLGLLGFPAYLRVAWRWLTALQLTRSFTSKWALGASAILFAAFAVAWMARYDVVATGTRPSGAYVTDRWFGRTYLCAPGSNADCTQVFPAAAVTHQSALDQWAAYPPVQQPRESPPDPWAAYRLDGQTPQQEGGTVWDKYPLVQQPKQSTSNPWAKYYLQPPAVHDTHGPLPPAQIDDGNKAKPTPIPSSSERHIPGTAGMQSNTIANFRAADQYAADWVATPTKRVLVRGPGGRALVLTVPTAFGDTAIINLAKAEIAKLPSQRSTDVVIEPVGQARSGWSVVPLE